MTDRSKTIGPLGSGFEHGLPVPLPYAGLAGVDPYCVVHDTVEDGVGDGVTDETATPPPIANWVANAVLVIVRSAVP